MAPEAAIDYRVTKLELLMEDYITQTNNTMNRLAKSTTALHEEMQDLKTEMREYVEESRASRAASRKEMDDFIEESKAIRAASQKEMDDFKAEMEKYREDEIAARKRMDQENIRFNKQMGELAHKMGTLVEDMVVPSLPRIAKELFGTKYIDDLQVRRYKGKANDKSSRREFDAIAVCNDYVILNETKSTPRIQSIEEFITFLKSNEFFEYFPEYKDKKLIPILSSLYFNPDVITHLTRNGILALGLNDSGMDLLNLQECRAKLGIQKRKKSQKLPSVKTP